MNAVAFGRHTLADQAFIKYLITKMFFALLLLVISSFHNAWAYRFLECDGCDSPFPPNTCWNHQPMKFKSGPIVFELQRQAFPDNSDNAKALEIATKRWEQLANVQFELRVSDSLVDPHTNFINEIGFGSFSEGAGAKITQNIMDWETCELIEADMIFDRTRFKKYHAAEDANHCPFINCVFRVNLVGAAVHEFGHVLGLAHENRYYNIMGDDFTHVNRNGDITYYGPGEDGATAARKLYGNIDAFDLGVSVYACRKTEPTDATCDDPTDLLHNKQYSIHEIPPIKGSYNPSYNGTNLSTGLYIDTGTVASFPFTFENNGGKAEDVIATVYLSEDATIEQKKDRELTRYGLRLTPDRPYETYLPVTIPDDLESGSYHSIGVYIRSKSRGTALEATDLNNAASHTFIIGNGNDPPIIYPDERKRIVNVIFETSLPFYPYATAEDPEGGPITWSVSSSPSHGTVEAINGSGHAFLYTPDFFYEGDDQFDYRVQDQYGAFSELATVKLSIVRPKNDLVVNTFGAGGRVLSNPGGIDCGTVCVAEFANNAVVDLTAIPDQGHLFDRWDTGCSGTGSCTVTMNTFRTVSAHFKVAPTSYTLTVGKTGTGSGTITSNPVVIDCGEDCTEDYPVGANAQITLTPNPDAGSTFRGWNGACSGMGACTVTMYADQNITATFATATPTIFTVSNLDDSGAGSLRQAILDANSNAGDDFILFENGINGKITLTSGQLAITDSVILDGPGANVLAISGNNASRIFKINPGTIGTVAINGLTLKDGNDVSGEGGGGVIIDSGTVTINNCTLSNNSAGIDNGGGGGGAIRKFGPGKLTVSNSTVSDNSAIDQFGQGDGGGIRNDQETLTIINSTVSGNSAASGGGIAFDDGRLTISNSTVTGNSADFGGGGILTGGGELVLGNSIVAGNKVPTGEKEIQNTGTTISQGHNLFGENGASGVSAGTTLAANDLILADAISTAIGPLADNGGSTQTHLPVAGGPAIDAGDNNLILQGVTTDQRGLGFLRIMDGTVDIGAVESIIKYTLSVSQKDGSGTITSDVGGIVCGATCSASFNSGTTVTLTATPDPGYLFTGWGGACSGPATTCTLPINAAKNVTASFVWLPRSSWKRALVR